MTELVLGRDAELAAAGEFLDAIESGSSALVFEGDPGIGKTTLWRETARRARLRGCAVLAARPVETEARLSFAALADLLVEVDDEVVAALPGPQVRALDAVRLRGDGDPATERRLVSTAVAAALTRLAMRSPLVVAIDDSQWLDRPSRSALEFAARRLEHAPVAFLLTVRAGSSPAGLLGLDRAVAPARFRRVRVGPLGLAALHRLITERLGEALPRSALRRVERASDGNPFFALEIARVLLRNGIPPPGEPLPVPDEVTALVAQRLARLPARTRSALIAAAALAHSTTRIVDGAALAPAVDAGIVRIESGGLVRFAHPLFASGVYAAASRAERRRVHRRLAEEVEEIEERAHHLALCSDGPNPEVAQTLEDAAAQAARRGAPETAAALLDQARRATPADRTEDAARRALLAAEHHFQAGDRGRARALAEELLAASRRSSIRSRARRLLGQDRYHDNDLAAAVSLFTAALADARGDAALAAPVELHLSFVRVLIGDLPAASAHAHAALRHARQLDDAGLLAEGLAVATICDFLAGAGLDQAAIDEALRLEDPLRPTFVQFRPTSVAGLLAMWTDRLDDAHALLRRLRTQMLERGDESELPMGTFHLTWVECWRGDIPAAATLADEALAVAEQTGGDATRALALLARAFARSYAGDVGGARGDAQEAIAICERIGWRYAIAWGLTILGFAALSTGDAAEVDRTLRPLVDLVEEIGVTEPTTVPFLPDEVEALVSLGELERAEELLEPFQRQAEERGRVWARATALRCRGLIAAARSELDAASALLEAADALHERLEMPVERARTLLALGQVRRRRREKRSAADALESAAALFESAGARLWAERARAELERVALRRGTADELTPTERRVAELAAAGLTNRAIAEELFVSPKTVEANIARIYRKLEIRSRGELGAWVERQRGEVAEA